MPTDQRLIEDYIPIEAISAEARREKSVRKGHISMLQLRWARRRRARPSTSVRRRSWVIRHPHRLGVHRRSTAVPSYDERIAAPAGRGGGVGGNFML
jgi:hypothetical protein